jgi:hypothetical protein
MDSAATVSRAVVVATYRLSKERIADVAVACERAKATMVLSNGNVLPTGDGQAAVLVAGLTAGERRVPEELLELLRRTKAADALLLICNEPLVRPSVSLYRGRLALVGADATADTIASQLRVLLAERATASGVGAVGERAHPYWWSRDTRPSNATSVQYPEDHGGFTHVFALKGEIDLPPAMVKELRAALRDGSVRLTEGDGLLSSPSGASIGAIHYNPRRESILILWPPSPHTLWMVSAVRLPILSDLSCIGKGMSNMQASGGDVLLALSHGGSTGATQAITHDLAARAPFGGPAVFDAVSAMLTSGSDSWATITELR